MLAMRDVWFCAILFGSFYSSHARLASDCVGVAMGGMSICQSSFAIGCGHACLECDYVGHE